MNPAAAGSAGEVAGVRRSLGDPAPAARTAGEGPALALEGVDLSLGGRPVLAGVDLTIAAGEAVALVGPSGAGKTSLLRLLGGALRPDRGHVRVGGRDLGQLSRRELRAARASLGFVHQQLALVPQLRVFQNVLAGRFGHQGLVGALRASFLPRRAELLRAHADLERVGIPELLYRRTDTLSGGQQQRVALARALYQDPLAILADEPVSAVDPERARSLVDLLLSLTRERRLTLVVSLHDLGLAAGAFERLVGLRAGRVVYDGPPAGLDAGRRAALFALTPDAAAPHGA